MAAEIDPRAARLQARRKAYKGISFGITLICVGVVLLLNTMGRVGWGVWLDLLRLWPLILISIGIRSIFLPTRLHALALAGPLLIVAGFVYTVQGYHEAPGDMMWDGGSGETLEFSCSPPPREGPARLRLVLAMGGVALRTAPPAEQAAPGVDGGQRPASGLRGEVRYRGSEPPWACSDEGDLWLGEGSSGGRVHVVFPFIAHRDRWEARLSSSVPVAVRGDLVASHAHLDLRSFDLDHVDLDIVAANAGLRLGTPSRRVGVRLDGAAAHVKLRVPPGVCLTITRDRIFSVLRGDAVPRGRRGRRLVSVGCPADIPDDLPRYDFRIQMPFSTVVAETDDGA